MCVYDSAYSPCNEECGHLKTGATVEELLSNLNPLPPIADIDIPDKKEFTLENFLEDQVILLETLLEQTKKMTGVVYEVHKRMSDIRENTASKLNS